MLKTEIRSLIYRKEALAKRMLVELSNKQKVPWSLQLYFVISSFIQPPTVNSIVQVEKKNNAAALVYFQPSKRFFVAAATRRSSLSLL